MAYQEIELQAKCKGKQSSITLKPTQTMQTKCGCEYWLNSGAQKVKTMDCKPENSTEEGHIKQYVYNALAAHAFFSAEMALANLTKKVHKSKVEFALPKLPE